VSLPAKSVPLRRLSGPQVRPEGKATYLPHPDFPDTEFPWDQQPDEPNEAFGAFEIYKRLGYRRTLLNAYKKYSGKQSATQQAGFFADWSRRWHWVARANEWDAYRARLKDYARWKADLKEAEKWQAREQAHCEKAYRAAQLLLDRGITLAEHPVRRPTVQQVDGKRVEIYSPIGVKDLRSAAAIIKEGFEVGMAAIKEAMPGDPDLNFDPATATIDELKAFLARQTERARRSA
jgi:hypothetical protein